MAAASPAPARSGQSRARAGSPKLRPVRRVRPWSRRASRAWSTSELADRHVEIPEQVVQVRRRRSSSRSSTSASTGARASACPVKQANEGSHRLPPWADDCDPTLYGMPASYDEQGNYEYPEGFDPETGEWLPGYEKQREEWEHQYAEARARFEADRKQVEESRAKADEEDAIEVMALMRAVEDRLVTMYRQGELVGSLYAGHWHEAIAVGTAAALRPTDVLAPLHRDLGVHLWRGMEPWQVMASFMGKATGPTGGRDGTLHYGRPDLNILNPVSHIPDNYPVATGAACRVQVPRHGRCGHGLLRGRLNRVGGLPRGPEHRRGPGPAVHLHRGEQPVRLLHPAHPHHRGHRLRQQGRGVRDARHAGGRHRRVRRARGGRRGRRPGPGPETARR